MGFAEGYFSKQVNFHPFIAEPPSDRLQYIVVIPAFCESDMMNTLNSLWNCTRPQWDVEVIVVVNFSEKSDESVIQSSLEGVKILQEWIKAHSKTVFRVLLIEAFNLPAKHAGAGLARKIGMDEATYRFNQIGNAKGLIISFDADCTCDKNYFKAIEYYSERFPSANGFNIYFEHPVAGNEYPDKVYKSIIKYELHLRYVNQFLRYAGFPYAYHTLGSAFAVRAGTYTAQGGMNRRKAGEDFYFLHKIIPLGNFHEINTTRVIPSPRPSERAPFGTGAAINKLLSAPDDIMMTYNPESFIALKDFFATACQFHRKSLYEIDRLIENAPEPVTGFLQENNAAHAIDEINNNCASIKAFTNRFFRWFDALSIVKYLNDVHRSHYSFMNIREAAEVLLAYMGKKINCSRSEPEMLSRFRSIERKGLKLTHQQ